MQQLTSAQASLRVSNPAPFLSARSQYEVLGAFTSMDALIECLHDRGRDVTVVDGLLRAMISEYRQRARAQQPQQAAYWSLALLVAMQPSLARLGVLSRSWCVAAEDIGQMLVEQFLCALEAVDVVTPGVAARLNKQTARGLSWHLRRAQRQQGDHEVLYAQVSVFGFNPMDEVDDEDQRDVLQQLLVRALGDTLTSNQVELVVQTVVHGERLRSLLKRASCEYEAEALCERAYQSLKRQHSRLMTRVQALAVKAIPCEPCFVRALLASRRGGGHVAAT